MTRVGKKNQESQESPRKVTKKSIMKQSLLIGAAHLLLFTASISEGKARKPQSQEQAKKELREFESKRKIFEENVVVIHREVSDMYFIYATPFVVENEKIKNQSFVKKEKENGYGIQIRTRNFERSKIKVTVEIKSPAPVNWKTEGPDGKTQNIVTDLFVKEYDVEMVHGKIILGWGLEESDPSGEYELKVLYEGTPILKHQFSIK